MPEVSIKPILAAPVPAASAASAATAAGKSENAAAETRDSGTADNEGQKFANVLQRQMDKPSTSSDATPEKAADPATAGESPAPAAPLDLTMLLAGLPQAPAVPQSMPPGGTEATIDIRTTSAHAAPLTELLTRMTKGAASAKASPGAKDEGIMAMPPEMRAVTADKPEILASAAKSAAETAGFAASLAAASDKGEAAKDIATALPPAQTPDAAAVAHAAVLREPAVTKDAMPSLPVHSPVGAPGWQDDFGQKVTWLVGRDEQRAKLVLNPPHLGRVEVSLSVSNDHANALFVSASPAVRDALEQALPRLREILADAGITLGQASVNAESSQGGRNGSGEPAARARTSNGAMPLGAAPEALRLLRSNGLVDTFA